MDKIPIFYYHSIGTHSAFSLDLEVFRHHLDILVHRQYKTITFSELLREKFQFQERVAVLSFDDGIQDNFDIVLPELQKRGLVGTFFAVPGYDGRKRWVHEKKHKWSDVKRKDFDIPVQHMTTSHRKELLDCGMEIGSHSMSHRKLTEIPGVELEEEILGSKKKLEDELGVPIHTFCYPKGAYNAQIISCVKEAGYIGAARTWPRYFSSNVDPFKCNRFLVENPFYFKEVINGRAFNPMSFVTSGIKYKKLKYFQ